MNGEHIAVTGDRLEQLKQRATYPGTYTPPTGAIGSLLGIPVVVDESLPAEPGWELRHKCQRASAEEIQAGMAYINKLMGHGHD